MKICSLCKIDKDDSSYLVNKEICSRCLYEEKLKKISPEKKKKRVCKICEAPLISPRWTYCSDDCFEESKKQRLETLIKQRQKASQYSPGFPAKKQRRFLFYNAQREY